MLPTPPTTGIDSISPLLLSNTKVNTVQSYFHILKMNKLNYTEVVLESQSVWTTQTGNSLIKTDTYFHVTKKSKSLKEHLERVCLAKIKKNLKKKEFTLQSQTVKPFVKEQRHWSLLKLIIQGFRHLILESRPAVLCIQTELEMYDMRRILSLR